tara:strand:- start:8 stop:301 length:294 start_codon:yes stop_codon:yes gene_type:complete
MSVVPRLPFELISSIILEATTTQRQENLDAWKQSIAQVNSTIEGQVQQVLDDEYAEDDNWDDFIISSMDEFSEGSAFTYLFEVEPNYVEMDERDDVW